ncbi:MAG TPA: hypothetical protein VIL74_02030 [Pyrinomonadaceae bacterium]|jgi:hypothetical protein
MSDEIFTQSNHRRADIRDRDFAHDVDSLFVLSRGPARVSRIIIRFYSRYPRPPAPDLDFGP